jgi:ribonuclease HII
MTAAVLFDERALGAEGRAALSALRDSKRLSPRARAARVAVASRSARRIDAVGLHRANLEANHSALAGVAYEGAVLLCDYYLLEDVGGQAPRPLVRGDSTSELVPSTSGTSRYPS